MRDEEILHLGTGSFAERRTGRGRRGVPVVESRTADKTGRKTILMVE